MSCGRNKNCANYDECKIDSELCDKGCKNYARKLSEREQRGRMAYEAYCASSDNKSLVSGAALPPWLSLSDPIQRAWMAVGDVFTTERDALREDAERWRWLEINTISVEFSQGVICIEARIDPDISYDETLTAAVDAAKEGT